jgi:hypothetical protein
VWRADGGLPRLSGRGKKSIWVKQSGVDAMRSSLLTTFFAVIFALISHAAEPGSSVQSAERSKRNDPAIAVLDEALRAPLEAQSQAYLSNLEDAARRVMTLTPRNQLLRSRLSQALAGVGQADAEHDIKTLRSELLEAHEILAFQLVREAPLPKGFPEPTPVGEIRVQKYPPYRVARTKFTDGGSSSFMALFNHIASNQISMTAPVEMSYQNLEEKNLRALDMAFLYENPTIGQTGSTGKVEVADVAARTAVSIGVRGETSAEAVQSTHQLLKAWLADHADEYVAGGNVRVLGYNSPMISKEKRFFEVQIPVREKKQLSDRRQ